MRDPADRLVWKTRIVQGLFDQLLPAADIIKLFRFIDWLMVLPEDLKEGFRDELRVMRKERTMAMPVMTQTEELWFLEGKEAGEAKGRQEGQEQARKETLRKALHFRYGEAGETLELAGRDCSQALLDQMLEAMFAGKSLEEVSDIWSRATKETPEE